MKIISIVLAEDHAVVRQALKVLLEGDPTFEIVGEAADGLETVAMVDELRPDVLLLDLIMPGLNGLEVARQVTQRSPEVRIVVLSMHSDEEYVLEALGHGVMGYILKDSGASELVDAIKCVMEGQRYLSARLNERAIEHYTQSARSVPLRPYDRLTNREREVLQLSAEGESIPEIGRRLSISARTAETHRANVMRKLGMHTQAELIRFALRRGLLSLE